MKLKSINSVDKLRVFLIFGKMLMVFNFTWILKFSFHVSFPAPELILILQLRK